MEAKRIQPLGVELVRRGIVTEAEVNAKGYFNVPSGRKEKVVTYSKENMEEIHNYFRTDNVTILSGDFVEATRNARATAQKFADDSDSQLGSIRNAQQGQFSISDRDANTPHIKNIRAKLGATGTGWIETVRGYGYRFMGVRKVRS